MSKPLLLPLGDCPPGQIEALLDASFGADRKQRTAYLLRDGSKPIERLCFGLTDGTKLVGSIQCWPVELVETCGARTPIVLVGPVAVSPNCQTMGYGRRLMLAMLSEALEMGDPPLALIGDSAYYGLFGFSAEQTGGWKLPGPWEAHRLLARNPSGHELPHNAMLEPAAHQD